MKYLIYIIEKQQKIVNLIGTVLVAWILSALVSDIISRFLPSPTPIVTVASAEANPDQYSFQQGRDIAFYIPICERNLFDSLKQSPCSEAPVYVESDGEAQVDPNADPVRSSLSAKLLGTMVSNLEQYSFATIQESGKKETENYRIGDMILGTAKIYQIVRNRVYFTNGGRKEYLEVDNMPSLFKSGSPTASVPSTSSGGVKVDGNKVTVQKSKVDSTLQDLNQVIQQARMVPNYDNGQVDGFKIFGIRNGSIFKDLGLQNGDVINRINGTQIDSIEKALPMLQLLKTENSHTIDITRKGQKQTMEINIQ